MMNAVKFHEILAFDALLNDQGYCESQPLHQIGLMRQPVMKTPAEHRDGNIRGRGDVQLCVQTWAPTGAIRGVVALVHGISEHSGRYGYLVERLVERGFAVSALDNRGHGRSAGMHGHVDDWADYREDVLSFVHYVSAKFLRLPLFLYGHSLGALIVTDYVLLHPEGLDGLIVSGHPLRPAAVAKPTLIFLARLLSRYRPTTSFDLGLDDNMISRDPDVVKAYREDPLVHRRVTARWGTESLAAIDRVRARAGEIRMPLLVLHGGADQINSADGSRELFEKASSTDKKLIIYPGGYHEPHNDLDRERVASDVIDWLTEHLGQVTPRDSGI
jgi:Lysophospholipase